jgi:hypothetical protein
MAMTELLMGHGVVMTLPNCREFSLLLLRNWSNPKESHCCTSELKLVKQRRPKRRKSSVG